MAGSWVVPPQDLISSLSLLLTSISTFCCQYILYSVHHGSQERTRLYCAFSALQILAPSCSFLRQPLLPPLGHTHLPFLRQPLPPLGPTHLPFLRQPLLPPLGHTRVPFLSLPAPVSTAPPTPLLQLPRLTPTSLRRPCYATAGSSQRKVGGSAS